MKNHTTSYYLFILFAICFLVFQTITDIIRPYYTGNNDFLNYFFGIAPNFFSALGIPALFVIIIQELNIFQNKTIQTYTVATFTSTFGLICWEFFQLSSKNFVFDLNDIIWTVNGALLFFVICFLSTQRTQKT